MPTDKKPWYRSRTLWVNVPSAVAAMLLALNGHDLIRESPQVAAITASLLFWLNSYLRVVTTLPIGRN